MSKKDEVPGTRFVTMDAEEFTNVCQRLHEMLNGRVNKAWKKYQKTADDKDSDNHVEASKDAFAFVHLLEMVEHMTEEIRDMREALHSAGYEEDEGGTIAVVSDVLKKQYLN